MFVGVGVGRVGVGVGAVLCGCWWIMLIYD